MQKLTNFFKYNNAFILILGFLFLAAGSSFASETVRDAVIGQTIEETKGMDNSVLISADLNSLKQGMKIDDVSDVASSSSSSETASSSSSEAMSSSVSSEAGSSSSSVAN